MRPGRVGDEDPPGPDVTQPVGFAQGDQSAVGIEQGDFLARPVPGAFRPAGDRLPYTLIAWALDRDEDLLLMDQLGYARAALGPPDVLSQGLSLHLLGPDALDPDFDAATLARAIGKRRGVLKSLLLNQRVVAGLGNRDADESLWLAGIDPHRPAASLTSVRKRSIRSGLLV